MNQKTFINEFTVFIKCAVKLNEGVKRNGLSSLDGEIWDLDDEYFKQGLSLIADKTDPAIIDEILSNKIACEKDKYARQYKTIVKRAVLAIQAGLDTRLLIFVLLSYANLPPDAQKKVECELMRD